MLASPLPTAVTATSSPNNTTMTSIYNRPPPPSSQQQRYYHHDWPLNELEENVMTLATTIKLQQEQQQRQMLTRCRSSAVRCNTCQRKFHSKGNLANHQQLYQH